MVPRQRIADILTYNGPNHINDFWAPFLSVCHLTSKGRIICGCARDSTPKPKPAKAPTRTREPEIQQKSPAPPPIKRQHTSPWTPSTLKFPINYSRFRCGKSYATNFSATVMHSVKPLFVSESLLAISFLNIKIDVNFKNLFGVNFSSNFHMLDK